MKTKSKRATIKKLVTGSYAVTLPVAPLPPLPNLPPLAFGVYREFIHASIEMLRHGALPREQQVALVDLVALVHGREDEALRGHAVACGAPSFVPGWVPQAVVVRRSR